MVLTQLLVSSVNIAFTVSANLITLNSVVADDARLIGHPFYLSFPVTVMFLSIVLISFVLAMSKLFW